MNSPYFLRGYTLSVLVSFFCLLAGLYYLSLTQWFKVVGLDLRVAFFVALCIASFVVFSGLFRRGFTVSKYFIYAVVVFSWCVFNLAYHYYFGDDFALYFAMISFSQIVVTYYFFILFECSSFKLLSLLVSAVSLIATIALWVGLVEFLMPDSYRIALLGFLFDGSIPGSYYTRDISFFGSELRLGSFFLSPLTFSYSCIFLICYSIFLGRMRRSFFPSLLAFIAQVKTGLVGIFFVYFFNAFYKASYIAFLAVLVFFFGCAVLWDGYELLNVPQGSVFKSISFHLVGLVSGVRSGFEFPFLGRGFGTAGYLVYLAATEMGESSPFSAESAFLNGNESVWGVLAYQLGLGFLIAHILFFMSYLKFFFRVRCGAACGFILFTIFFQILSESPLTIFISFVSALFIVWMRKFYLEAKCL